MIPLVGADKLPTEIKDRWKVVEKMELVTQYTFAGDHTGLANCLRYDASVDFVYQWKPSTKLSTK